jgi:hypothetical protein
VKRARYRIEYSPPTRDHLEVLTARQRAVVMDAVHTRLGYDYEVDEKKRIVEVLAIGVKDRNRIFIGKEEIDLS